MKTYGYKTLLSFITVLAYTYIIADDRPQLFITASILVVVAAILFVPLIRIGNGHIKLLTLNPFATRINIPFNDISSVHVHAGDIRFKMSFTLKDGSTKNTSSFFRYYDMESLYDSLTDAGLDVTSTGVRAISWKR